jgi:hypothetical protein
MYHAFTLSRPVKIWFCIGLPLVKETELIFMPVSVRAERSLNKFLQFPDLAYRTALLLNLHVQEKAGDQIEGSEFSDELGRRLFWSCWITSCISQDNAVFRSVPWKEAVGLMFPSDEGSWASRKPISTEFFNDSGGIESNGSLSFDQQPSIMGEMAKACCLWYSPNKNPCLLVTDLIAGGKFSTPSSNTRTRSLASFRPELQLIWSWIHDSGLSSKIFILTYDIRMQVHSSLGKSIHINSS